MPTVNLHNLTDRDCLARLDTVSVGRLLFTENALPAIRPVRFTTANRRILLAATQGSWTDKLQGVLVAFAADDIDPTTHTGWNVLIHGTARLTTDPDRLLTIAIERITGQRLTLTTPPPRRPK